ncbi:MaoC family dehydratase [bacterium]|nr:MAG: MaoC family dehydratase [bacterium]
METLTFAQTAPGDRREVTIPVSPEALAAFAALTGDVNPLHTDPAFARERGFPARVAHGMLVSSYFSALVGTMLPGRDCLLQSAKFDFKRPVLEGEALTFSVEVLQKVEAVRVLVLDAKAVGPDGTLRVSGRMQVGFTS